MKHRIGIMQGRLTEPKGRGIQFFPFDNWEKEFFLASGLGLDEIEFIFDYDRYEENPLWTKEGIVRLKKVIKESGVRVHAICFDYFMRRPFYIFPEEEMEEIKKENTEFIKRVISTMEELDISLIEIPSVDNSSIANDYQMGLYKEWIIALAKEFKNIKFSMETDLTVKRFVSLIDEIGLENVGANYDSGNSSGRGYNLYEEVTTLSNRIFNIHIKDRVYGGTTVQLGNGSADFDSLFRGLFEIKYSGAFILQAARGEEGKEEENIALQKKYLLNLISRSGV